LNARDPLGRFRLDGKVALVTGASSGLGVQLAEALHLAGADVVLVARRRDRLEAFAGRLGERATPVSADVRSREAVQRAFAAVADTHGRLDVLVNAAGVQHIAPAQHEDEAIIRETIETNLLGALFCAQAAAEMMLPARSGSIINVASILGLVGIGSRPQAAYCASKGGLVNLTRELAAQWAPVGIRVNALAPGTFLTEMSREALSSPEVRAWVLERTPMGRLGEPQELDGACIFLASDASSYVTGQVLAVDGGWTSI
jgi:NAD(P)-dependent dehydrogenase (short-subunit alcohol dehydrogenase family)